MKIFCCTKCNWTSLVRSNFKFTCDHQATCRAVAVCERRVEDSNSLGAILGRALMEKAS